MHSNCHICNSVDLQNISNNNLKGFKPVSSDTRIVSGDLRVAVCSDCGAVQKVINEKWQSDISDLYNNYTINYQSEGADPYIFNSIYGSGPRAEILLKFLREQISISEKGRLLDFGCANGNILRAFSKQFPNWELYGVEYSEKWREVVLSIPSVKGFSSDIKMLGEKTFDLIIISHVLEHITKPVEFLNMLKTYLSDDGKILIAVPDIMQNPIDLMVLDHCTHFDINSIEKVIKNAGLFSDTICDNILNKEISVIISKVSNSKNNIMTNKINSFELVEGYLNLLDSIRKEALDIRAGSKKFGLMGTSTASVWLTAELNNNVDFYVDEDTNRIGGKIFGKPIYCPEDVPEDSNIFIPMSNNIAEKIRARYPRVKNKFYYYNWNSDLQKISA